MAGESKDKLMDRPTDKWTGYINWQPDRQMNRHIDRLKEKQIDEYRLTNRQTNILPEE